MEPRDKPNDEIDSQNTSVHRHAFLTASGTLLSRILGMLRDMLIAALFPTMVTDAFVVACRLPNFFRRLLTEGSMAASLIPLLVSHDRAKTREFLNSVWTLLVIGLGVLVALAIVWMDPLMHWMVGEQGYLSVPGKMELTIRLGRIIFGFIFFVSLYSYLASILQSRGRFGIAAAAPALFNAILIIFALFPDHWFSMPPDKLAWGVLIGSIGQVLFVIPSVRTTGLLPVLSHIHWTPALSQFWLRLLPGFVTMGVSQLVTLLNVYFAARLGQGSHSWLYWADRLLEFPLSLIGVSLGSALLPALTRAWDQKQHSLFLTQARESLQTNLYLAAPATLALWIIAYPAVNLIYERGQFAAHDTIMTSQVLQWYLLALIPLSCSRILQSCLLAQHRPYLPAALGLLSLIAHLILAPFLMNQLGVVGLALAFAITSWIYFLSLSFTNPQIFFELGRQLFIIVLSTFVMALPLLTMARFQVFLGRSLGLISNCLIAASLYIAVSYALRSKPAGQIVDSVRQSLKNKF